MKKLYSLSTLLVVLIFFSGCSKDIFKPYDDRIEGVWELTDVDKVGWGSTNLNFTGGRFTFYGSGKVEYEDGYGGFYEGRWDIRNRNIPDCYIDENGNSICDGRNVRTLSINVTDFVTHDVLSEYFDEIVFTGTNRFKAYLYDGNRTYVFRFRR
jgi:hypothetical protein